MPDAEMLSMHDFDDWQSAESLLKCSQMGLGTVIGLIGDGTSQTVRWIDGTPFDYNNTQSPIPPMSPGVDYCAFIMNVGPLFPANYYLSPCNQTVPQASAICYLPVGQQARNRPKACLKW